MLANKISIYLSSKYILRGKAANSCSTGLPLQTAGRAQITSPNP